MTQWVWNTNARVIPGNTEKTMVFNNESGWAANLSGVGLDYIRKINQARELADDELDTYPGPIVDLLKEKRVLIEAEEAEAYHANVNEMLRKHIQDKWMLTILPTERCNFDCYYCYEDRIIGKMKPHVADAVDNLVRRYALEAPSLSLSFFGGEPLMAPDLVLRFMKTAYEHAPDRERLLGGVTTNGSLLKKDMLEGFVAHNLFHYQITLDGPKHMHDKQRVSLSKKGTFERVIQALDLIYHNDNEYVDVNVRVNMHAHLASEYQVLLDHPLIRKVMSDRRFYFTIHEIWGSEKYTVPEEALNAQENLAKTKQVFMNFENEVKNVTIKRATLAGPCAEACYAGKPNQFMIYPTGDVGKCTVVLKEDRNFVGKVGPDGELLLNNQKHHYWVGQNALNDAGCQTCAYKVSCAGIGCPINRVKPGDGTCSLRNTYDHGLRYAFAV